MISPFMEIEGEMIVKAHVTNVGKIEDVDARSLPESMINPYENSVDYESMPKYHFTMALTNDTPYRFYFLSKENAEAVRKDIIKKVTDWYNQDFSATTWN